MPKFFSTYEAYEYARSQNCRIPQFEKELIKDPLNAARYAAHVINGRWLEAEESIASHPCAAILYAKQVIGEKWEPGEAAIAQYSAYSYEYALVNKERFLLGEQTISCQKSYSILYAKNVIKGRFHIAEANIEKDYYKLSQYLEFLSNKDIAGLAGLNDEEFLIMKLKYRDEQLNEELCELVYGKKYKNSKD